VRSIAAIFTFALFVAASSCGPPPKPSRPARPSKEPKETLPAGDACDSDANPDLRRFTDPERRISFCAPSIAKVGWQKVVEELNTIEEMWWAPDDSVNFAVVILKNVPTWATSLGKPTPDAKVDTDNDDARLAGRKARHYRVRWHEHRERSSALDENGNHFHEEASDHDVTLDRWSVLLPAGGIMMLTIRTQENTNEDTTKLLFRIAGTLRFDK
jgi:hypothetical protein